MNDGDIVEIDPQEYCFYYFATGWQKINLFDSTTGTTHRRASVLNQVTPITKVRHAEFNFGSGNSACFVDGANPAIVYDGTDWVTLTSGGSGVKSSAGGGQCLNLPAVVDVFKNHLFLSGDPTNAWFVIQSEDPFNFVQANGARQLLPGFDLVDLRHLETIYFLWN